MAANRHRGSPGSASGWLARWSERKRTAVESAHAPASEVGPRDEQQADAGAAATALTDQDMPPLESLDENSDYSGFLSPGVSRELQRMALRKLFGGAAFRVTDGLDDYDRDYNLLQTSPRVTVAIAQDAVQSALRGQRRTQGDGGASSPPAPSPPSDDAAVEDTAAADATGRPTGDTS